YERLLVLPLAESPHYFHRVQSPSWASIAKLLRVIGSEMVREKRNQNGLKGIQRSYLEERLHRLQKDGDWPTVMDVYGLLVYGTVLFPHGDDYVDLAAIDAYLAKRDKGENPTIALLANTYYTLNYCCERKGGSLRCCTHLLYLWLTIHLFHSKRKTTCPVEDFKWSWIKTMSRDHWTRKLNEALERTICWYPMWNEREELIIPKCPIPGNLGGHQLQPQVDILTSRIPHDQGPSGRNHDSFHDTWAGGPQWRASPEDQTHLEEHCKKRRLELEETLAQMESKQRSLKKRLKEASMALASEEKEVSRGQQLSERTSKKAHAKEEDRLRIGNCLRAVNQEMCFRRAECNQVMVEKEQLKEALLNLKARETRRRIARAKLSKEHLEGQRRQGLIELVKT
ncbi:hypothetical protein CR513_01446, partial [Mucuna pruriens]